MSQIIISVIAALVVLVGGYLITIKTNLTNMIKSKVSNDTYELLKNICRDFCQHANDKIDKLEERKEYVNTETYKYIKEFTGVEVPMVIIDNTRHTIIEEAKKVLKVSQKNNGGV